MRFLGKSIAMLLPVALLVGTVIAFNHATKERASGAAGEYLSGSGVAGAAPTAARCLDKARQEPLGETAQAPMVGVAPDSPWGTDLRRFVKITKVSPQIVVSYVKFGSPFDVAKACMVTRMGALPLIQMLPRHASLADISAGKYDAYLSSYARSIKKSRLAVVFSFAHEMNGKWYPWGYRHTSPVVYIAAWRHMHHVFASAGATRVIWCWNPNGIIPNPNLETPARTWWPGAAYVNWVGIDDYFNFPTDTFATAIGTTLARIRQFTHKPVLITETAVASGPQEVAQIASLFAGVRSTAGILGFIWFNHNKRETWRIYNRPAAIAAFRRGARSLH